MPLLENDLKRDIQLSNLDLVWVHLVVALATVVMQFFKGINSNLENSADVTNNILMDTANFMEIETFQKVKLIQKQEWLMQKLEHISLSSCNISQIIILYNSSRTQTRKSKEQ